MLEKVSKDDFSYIHQLYMHPEVNPYLLYEMMDEKTFRPIFDDLLKDEVLYLIKKVPKLWECANSFGKNTETTISYI